MKTPSILIVDDEPSMRMSLSESLQNRGYDVQTAGDGTEALDALEKQRFAVVISDIRMPGTSGMELLRHVKKTSVQTPVIIMTAFGTVGTAVEAMKEGATDFIMKPFSMEHFEMVVEKVISNNGNGEKPENQTFPQLSSVDKTIITDDESMLTLMGLLKNVSRSKSSILIQGESGTGKELLARYIHRNSKRAHMPFVAVNCAAIPHHLLESEMFGYEKGAFTGASMRKLGKFELASGGTLLLDEIGEMDLQLQAKLLRVIQESEVDRLGAKAPVPVDIRIIATTNADLKKHIEGKKFRGDLYYRLNVIPIHVPPLRERRGDIAPLAAYFLGKYSTINETDIPTLSSRALQLLKEYNWPGNVRELENIMERSVLMCNGQIILPEHLCLAHEGGGGPFPETIMSAPDQCDVVPFEGIPLREVEKRVIYKTLETVNGNRTRASEILGISVRTMRNKLNEYKEEELNLDQST